MTATAPAGVENGAYQFPLDHTALVSFPAMWLSVAETCSSVFAAFETKVPDEELSQFYNELNAKMCRAHALVYRLTAFECVDCPELVRGTNAARVVGAQRESTQVLVVYYLLRELLKKQLSQTKERMIQNPDRVVGYIRGFEKFTAALNFVKSAFTYLHWAWQKRGLPAEHIILPTEIVALTLWCEHVLDREMKEALKGKVAEILRAFRQGYPLDVSAMENVKRLSLDLLLLNDAHQVLHASIIEDPYIAMVVSHFAVEKRRYKNRGPEDYVRICTEELEREELKTKCFLAQTSYAKVHQRLVDTLVSDEHEYLQTAADKWLSAPDDQEARRSLTLLYKLLGNGTQKTWMEKAVENFVITVFTTKDTATQPTSQESPTTSTLRSLKYTHNTCHKFIIETFGSLELLLKALEDGLNVCLKSKPDISPKEMAAQLAFFAAEEVRKNTVFLGPEGHWVADVYKLLSEKDVFSREYVMLLCSRLLMSRFMSDTARLQMMHSERNMVSRLFIKGTNFDFVSWCNGMLDDVLDRSARYQALIPSSNAAVSLSPVVLRRHHWAPLLPPRTTTTMAVPQDLFDLSRNFMKSFSQKRLSPGHTLRLLGHYSVVTVRYTFASSNVRIILPLEEYAVAMQFTKKREWNVAALAAALSIQVSELQPLLKRFASFGLMEIGETARLIPYTGTDNCLNFNDHVTFWKEKKTADDMLVPFASGASVTVSESTLQVFVITTLKNEGPLTLDSLYVAVQQRHSAQQLQKRELKQCIEKLLERGFVMRSLDDEFSFVP